MKITNKHYRCALDIPAFIHNERVVKPSIGMKALRLAANMKRDPFALAVGVRSGRTIEGYEHGRYPIPLSVMIAMHAKFKRRTF